MRIVDANGVLEILGCWSKKTLDRKIKSGEFPTPSFLGQKRVWLEDAVIDFVRRSLVPQSARAEQLSAKGRELRQRRREKTEQGAA